MPYQYLTFFMEDDEELKRIGERQDLSACDPEAMSPREYVMIRSSNTSRAACSLMFRLSAAPLA